MQAGFTQINKLKLADDDVDFDASIIKDVKNCHNPTFIAGQAERRTTSPRSRRSRPTATGPARARAPRTSGAFNENPDDDGKVPTAPAATAAATGGGGGTGRRRPAATAPAAAPPTATATASRTPRPGPSPGWPATSGLGGTTTDGARRPPRSWPTTLAADGSAGPPGVLTALVVGLFLGTLVVPDGRQPDASRAGEAAR